MDIEWRDILPWLLLCAVAGWKVYNLNRKGFPKPSKKTGALGAGLGLQYRRDIWKGTAWWEGTWGQVAVRVTLSEAEGPRIEIGQPSKKKGEDKALWMVMDRKLEERLIIKDEPDPVPTGDRRFDERFNLRLYGATPLTPPMRALLLDAGPEIVALYPRGLEYLFQEGPTLPKVKAHLDAATGIARAAGIPTALPTAEARA